MWGSWLELALEKRHTQGNSIVPMRNWLRHLRLACNGHLTWVSSQGWLQSDLCLPGCQCSSCERGGAESVDVYVTLWGIGAQ